MFYGPRYGKNQCTAHALAWSILELARDPALQFRMHLEAARQLGGEAVCPRHEALRPLDRFEALAMEAMRFHPVVAFFAQHTLRPTVIGDVAVPADTRLFYISRPAQLDAQHFSEPLRFDPERWVAGTSAGSNEGRTHEPRAHLQFGAGPRVCPGRHLAVQEIRLVLSMLLREFEITLACDEGEIHEVLNFTNLPNRLPVRLRRRVNEAGPGPAPLAPPAPSSAPRCPVSGH